MSKILRALVIDDDQDAAEWLVYQLQTRFPGIRTELRLSPNISGTFDLYFIDNDFHGTSLAGALAEAVRDQHPQALIVAFSARLDNPTLKQLVNAGCDGAFDKSNPDEVAQMLGIVEAYLQRSDRDSRPGGFFSAIRSIRELLHEWNRRLENDPWKEHPAPTAAGAIAHRSDREQVGSAS
ncbi:MAG: response regulator [Planctomycetaceae bacterium]